MPRPRRCQVREGQPHQWVIAGDHWICERCKEPGPDINDVLIDIWEASVPRCASLDDRLALLQAVVGRAEGVLQYFSDAAAVLEAEMAAAGRLEPESPEERLRRNRGTLSCLLAERKELQELQHPSPTQMKREVFLDILVKDFAKATGLEELLHQDPPSSVGSAA